MTRKLRVTPAQRRLLERLADGLAVVAEAMETHVAPGTVGRTESVLWRLHQKGLVRWDGPIEFAVITPEGRRAIGRQ